MSQPTLLFLDWCSYAAARYAVEHWHYSRCLPHQKLIKLGVWENGVFIGAVVFGDGANKNMVAPYGLSYTQGCELVRIALRDHATPVSRIVRIALQRLHAACPDLRLVVSYADSAQGHLGTIYQASNWLYVGMTIPCDEYIARGQRFQGRALRSTRSTHGLRHVPAANVLEWSKQVLDLAAVRVQGSRKYRYLYPFDAGLRTQLLPLAQPYPKRATSIAVDAPAVQAGEGGSTPTVALSEGA